MTVFLNFRSIFKQTRSAAMRRIMSLCFGSTYMISFLYVTLGRASDQQCDSGGVSLLYDVGCDELINRAFKDNILP